MAFGFRKTATAVKKPDRQILHILRRDCLLEHVIEGKVEERLEVTGRRERRLRLKQLLDDLTERWKLKEKALECTLRRTRVGRSYGHIVRQTAERLLQGILKAVCSTVLYTVPNKII